MTATAPASTVLFGRRRRGLFALRLARYAAALGRTFAIGGGSSSDDGGGGGGCGLQRGKRRRPSTATMRNEGQVSVSLGAIMRIR